MFESIAKSSSYRSQIHARVASPGSSSPIDLYKTIARRQSVEHSDMSNEKVQLRKLNDRFLSYIERVRLFETYNHCLTLHSEQIQRAQERTRTKLDLAKKEFDEYQHERYNREINDQQLESNHLHQIEQQVNDLKTKQTIGEHQHEQYRKQIIDLQKQSIDIQVSCLIIYVN
jgi:hypothetical protein